MAGVYIHIPYCHIKCAYCDFYSTPDRKSERLLTDCLVRELELRRGEIGTICTIYLGGGTPSIIDDTELEKILAHLPVDQAEEVTIEANPEDVTAERVQYWRSLGINRISMGVQSFDDAELKVIGRRHTAIEAISAIENIRKGGIENFSIDLIYGLPGQTLESWQKSLEGLFDIQPYHFSAYMLTYEPRTRLTAMLNTGKIKAVDEEVIVEMYKMLTESARKAGYEHYEISNFAIPGFRSRHNSSYWNDTPYLGLGPGAHSFDGKVRRVNPSDIGGYIQAIERDELPCTVEEESKTDVYNDLVITALRTKEGLDFGRVKRSRRRQFLCDAFPYLLRGELEVDENFFKIPEEHWLISDAIMRDLMQ